ncbi:unnamed protein product, partial [Oikopleura dioica]
LASRKKMESDVDQMKCQDLDSLFIGSTKWFDVLVNLKEMKEAKLKMANETGKNKHRLEIPDWSPVKLVFDTYSRALGHSALFFADEHNQKILGVKFRNVGDLKGLQGECLGGMARDELSKMYLNKVGLVNDMKILAENAIESISVQKDI